VWGNGKKEKTRGKRPWYQGRERGKTLGGLRGLGVGKRKFPMMWYYKTDRKEGDQKVGNPSVGEAKGGGAFRT